VMSGMSPKIRDEIEDIELRLEVLEESHRQLNSLVNQCRGGITALHWAGALIGLLISLAHCFA